MATNVESSRLMQPNADNIGPTISNNVTKVLEECVQALVDQLPPSTGQKDKGRVKRPMNAFMVYSQTARKAMAKVYPNLSYRTLSKALGKNWGVMGLDEKRPFIREAERLRLKHQQDYPNYKFKPSKNRQRRRNFSTPKQCFQSSTVTNTFNDDCKTLPGYVGKMTHPVSEARSVSFSKACEQYNADNRLDCLQESRERSYFAESNLELPHWSNDFRAHEQLSFEKELVPLQQPYNSFNNSSPDAFQRAQATSTTATDANPSRYLAFGFQPSCDPISPTVTSYQEPRAPGMDTLGLIPDTTCSSQQQGCYQNDFANIYDFMAI